MPTPQTTQQAIDLAWIGNTANYSKVNGWAVKYVANGIDDFSKEMQETFDIEYVLQDLMRYRPKSLAGIENQLIN